MTGIEPIVLFRSGNRRTVVDLHPFQDPNRNRMGRFYFKTAIAAVTLPFSPVVSFGVGCSAIADLVTRIEDTPTADNAKRR